MRIISFLQITCLFLVLTACKKELPFPDVDAPPMVVINSFFNPDTTLLVHVSESCHITDSFCDNKAISDATVLIKDETGTTLTTLAHQQNGIYSAPNFEITATQNYQIEVQKSGFETATAIAATPQPIAVELMDVAEGPFENIIAWGFDIAIQDNPDEANYYVIEGFIEIVGGHHDLQSIEEINGYIAPHTAHYTTDSHAHNKAIQSGVDYEVQGLRGVYLSDENFNGENHHTRLGIRDWDIIFGDFDELIAHISVKSVSKTLFDYYISLEKNRLARGNFFTEPEPIATNIQNGLGIFAGFTQQEFSFPLPESEYKIPTEIFLENDGCTAPCTVKFSTNGGKQFSYNWNFGDGSSSLEANPEHQYTAPGEYLAELIFSESPGNISIFTVDVRIN